MTNNSTDPSATSVPARPEPVLVTGGSGYLGSHVVVRLLREGYQVRTTVRSAERASTVHAAVHAAGIDPGNRLEIAPADLSTDDGWHSVVAGCAHVLHVASPFPAQQPTHDDEVIAPARDGALRVLRAARDAGVPRVVMTSSFAAVGYSSKARDEYDETDWTDPADDNTAYIRSKTIAERAAWDFVQTEGGTLELTVINPTGIFGPLLSSHLSTSTGIIKSMLDGDMPAVPRQFFGVVDVRDVADIHVRAMTDPAAAGQRFLASSGAAINFFTMAKTLAQHFDRYADQVPARELSDDEVRAAAQTNPGLRESVNHLGRVPVIHTEKARSMLNWQPREPETSIVDTADSLIRLGLVA